jgi:hypothetical protein
VTGAVVAGFIVLAAFGYGFTSELHRPRPRPSSSSVSTSRPRVSTRPTTLRQRQRVSAPVVSHGFDRTTVASAIVVTLVVTLLLVHEVALFLIVGTVALGAGGLRHRATERARARDEALDVAEWVDAHTFASDTAPEIVHSLRGTSLGQLRSQMADRAFWRGWAAAEAAARRRRSVAARERSLRSGNSGRDRS